METDRYCRGYCSEFAVALNNVFGYRLGAFYEIEADGDDEYYVLVHAFTYHPQNQNLIIDARGIRSKAVVKANLVSSNLNPNFKEKRVTPTILDQEGGEGLNKELIERAQEYIMNHKKTYAVLTSPLVDTAKKLRLATFRQNLNDLEGVVEESRRKIEGIKNTLKNMIEHLPDNPNISRINNRSYTMPNSALSKDLKLSPFYYDHKAQYRWIIDKIDAMNPTRIQSFLEQFVDDVQSNKSIYDNGKTLYFDPELAKKLKALVND